MKFMLQSSLSNNVERTNPDKVSSEAESDRVNVFIPSSNALWIVLHYAKKPSLNELEALLGVSGGKMVSR